MKMKKLVLIAILTFLLLPSVLYAVDFTGLTFTEIQAKSIAIQGVYGDVLDVGLTPIPAQSTTFMQGMPFNIENSYTWYGKSQVGREIAYWSFAANCNFILKICAEHMHLSDKEHMYYDTAQRLGYILTFTCSPSFTDADKTIGNNGEVDNADFRFTVASQNNLDMDNPDWNNPSGSWSLFGTDSMYTYGGGYVASSIGSIFFQFTEAATNVISSEENFGLDTAQVPSGNWEATVILRLEVV